DGERIVLTAGAPAFGANVRSAHDDWNEGTTAIAADTRIGPAQLGVLASFGHDGVAVRRRVQAIAIATGDELLAPGAEWRTGFRYDSNGPVLAALCATHGVELAARWRVRDDSTKLRAALLEAARSSDLVLTTGGVSAGEADFLPGILAEIGDTWFWKVAMRPGMPVLAGQVEGTPVFALPGNPVSVVATFCALVRPALAVLSGCPALDPKPRVARLTVDVAKAHDRLELRRASLSVDDDGVLHATPHASTSSGALRSVAESDVLVELAAEGRQWRAGDRVPTYALQP
ncbi:MAG TPA: molybdopterin molybdotransferase MoeA, partial [Xanthomonadales bacterium]|nr:molybdopterin molybdotransferase MoeA [Xanthomonadales bacterium]